jgi:hypothetical protein
MREGRHYSVPVWYERAKMVLAVIAGALTLYGWLLLTMSWG